MAMSEQEWQVLLAKKRRATGNWAIGTQPYLVVLGILIWMLALAPTAYFVVNAVEKLQGLSLSQNRAPEQTRFH
jgi:hypothetical protein